MKNIAIVALILLAVLAFTPAAFGQTTTVQTILSSAITDTSGTIVQVASSTSITASTTSLQQYCFIDNEEFFVRAIPSSGILQVRRGEGGTVGAQHANSSVVTCGPAGNYQSTTSVSSGVFVRNNPIPGSTCVVVSQGFTLIVNPVEGLYWRCNASSLRWEAASYNVFDAGNGFLPILDPGDAAYTATLQDYHIHYRQASAGRTVTLPSVTNIWGKTLIVTEFTTGTAQTITVAAPNGQLINGAATNTTIVSSGLGLRLRSFNSGWVTW